LQTKSAKLKSVLRVTGRVQECVPVYSDSQSQ